MIREKLKLLVTGKNKKTCFKIVQFLETFYAIMKKAWMTTKIHQKCLQQYDCKRTGNNKEIESTLLEKNFNEA